MIFNYRTIHFSEYFVAINIKGRGKKSIQPEKGDREPEGSQDRYLSGNLAETTLGLLWQTVIEKEIFCGVKNSLNRKGSDEERRGKR